MSCVFATLIIVAADFSTYWIHQEVWRVGIFYAATPAVLLLINCAGVKVYDRLFILSVRRLISI
jgi:hypothetical protein